MKKKGLIISTIVMVVVLIASLTTATYAWFSADAKTSIQGFDVNVVSNNVVNIGLKGSSYTNGTSADEFVSGTCEYTQGAGVGGTSAYAFGSWSGNPSLAPKIDETDVLWGTQSRAVGFVNTHNAASADGTTALFVPEIATNVFTPFAANGTGASVITGTPAVAKENYGETATDAGDFAYLFLGVQATKKLTNGTNKFTIVLVPQGNGTTLGISAAIHIAYRVKLGTGAWSNWDDIDVYGTNRYNIARNASTVTAVTLNGNFVEDFSGAGTATYDANTKLTTAPAGSAAYSIALSDYEDASSPAPIDQIELIIYLAGHDDDCINSAINGMQTKVFMFFEAQEYTAPVTP